MTEINEESGLNFTLNNNGSGYVVFGIKDKNAARAIIPATFRGLPVTEIASNAFKDCESLQSVEIPAGIIKIGSFAFMHCAALTEIKIPESVKEIDGYAFYGCSGLTEAFIPAGVEKIGWNPFSCCAGLEKIGVDGANKRFISAGCCLIDTKNKLLITGCKNSVIPDDGNVTVLGWESFFGCEGLTSIEIPVCVTEIVRYAFEYCMNLRDIYYRGTKEQWGQIEKEYGWQDFLDCVVHCTDGDLKYSL